MALLAKAAAAMFLVAVAIAVVTGVVSNHGDIDHNAPVNLNCEVGQPVQQLTNGARTRFLPTGGCAP
jgi:hypothetical protein